MRALKHTCWGILVVATALVTATPAARAGLVSFSGGAITVPATGTAGKSNPYPSTINVSGLTGLVKSLDVVLLGLTHGGPGDLDILLVAPDGRNVLLMSDVGGAIDVAAIDLTFRDGAGDLPDPPPLASGTYKPADRGTPLETLPSPAPARPYGASIQGLLGGNPNGAWNLYVNDDASGDSGRLGRWRLDFTTSDADPVPAPASLSLLVLGLAGIACRRRKRSA